MKKHILIKEDTDERDYAADVNSSNSDGNASSIVSQTKSEHPDADSVTIPSSSLNGDSSTQPETVEMNKNNPNLNSDARVIAQSLKSRGINANFKINTESRAVSKDKMTNIYENSIPFSGKEFKLFLKKIL